MRMSEHAWSELWDLGEDFIPKDRYLSREFLALELEKLWPRVWQVACRVEQLPEQGCFVEYTIGDQSILVVRVDAHTIKAYFNSCRHRGMRLGTGCGQFEGRTISCPFHGWTYGLDGANTHVASPGQFSDEALRESNLRLRECRVGQWGGFIFINMDPAAPPLEEALAPATRWLDPMAIDRMGVLWHKVVELPVNWKAALDAFTESYHVLTTHPEYRAFGTDGDAFNYYQDPGGHSHYAIPPTTNTTTPADVDPRERFYRYVSYNIDEIGAMYTERDRHIAARLMQREIPADSSVALEYTRELYAHAEGAGIRLPKPAPEVFEHVGVHYVFPHLMFLPTLGNALCYRARPHATDPESTEWDVWSLTIFPEGEPPPAYEVQHVDWRDPAQVGRVLHQDFSNMYEMRTGMKSRAFEGMRLNTVQEMGLLHMQREIDRYLRG
jgi:phenylpropionate dioxygenase-like ring-hydroxylating dioxygenase large terminal subunit